MVRTAPIPAAHSSGGWVLPCRGLHAQSQRKGAAGHQTLGHKPGWGMALSLKEQRLALPHRVVVGP